MIYRHAGDVPRRIADVETAGGWAVFTITGAIQSQFNVSSVTDNGVGDWTVNWAVAFGATTYAVAGCTRDQTSGSVGSVLGLDHFAVSSADTITASSIRVLTGNSLGARRDPTDGIYIVAIGRR